MPPGRPPQPGTAEQRAAARRQKVRANVQAFRRRQRESLQHGSHSSALTISHPSPSNYLTVHTASQFPATSSFQLESVAATLPSPPQAVLKARVDDFGREWTVDVPFRIDMGPAYSAAFIEALQYRSMVESHPASTDGVENVRLTVCCYALVTTSLKLLSIERNDSTISTYAFSVHARGLRRLRATLAHFMANRASANSSFLYATVMTLSLSELLVNKSWENFAKHMLGIGALIQLEGPEALTSTLTQDNFCGYRAIQATFSFIYRRGSFLSKRVWIDLPWRQSHGVANNPYHTLLDIAFQIPDEMEKFDKTVGKSPQILRTQLGRLNEIASQLQEWMSRLLESYDSTIYTTDTLSWDGLQNSAIEFCNADVAIAYTFFAGVKIAVCGLTRQIMGELNNQGQPEQELLHDVVLESYKWSRTVFQCLEYYFARDRKVVGKLICLFTFDVAWETTQILKEK